LQIEAIGFNRRESLEDYCSKNHMDLLLLPIEDRDFKSEAVAKTIILSADKMVSVTDVCIYKYQSMNTIVDEIISMIPYNNAERFLNVSGTKKRVLGVYSPIGRCFKTSFALSLAKLYAVDNKVLYINLEEYSGLARFISRDFEHTLSDIMLMYMQEAGTILLKQERMIRDIYNVSILPPLSCIRDIFEISIEMWKGYFELLVTGSVYEVIIIDFGTTSFFREELFELCDVIYVPGIKGTSAAVKLEEFAKYIEKIKDGKLKNRIVNIELPYIEELKTADSFAMVAMNLEFTKYVREIMQWKN